jgi:Fis family transcriptional regulator
MLELVLEHANGNQSLAAEYLGINRNTLRKKLQQHGLL